MHIELKKTHENLEFECEIFVAKLAVKTVEFNVLFWCLQALTIIIFKYVKFVDFTSLSTLF